LFRHRDVQRVQTREWPGIEGALRHPRRMFEDPADGLDKTGTIQQIELGHRHG
jgi:hypothetical protein